MNELTRTPYNLIVKLILIFSWLGYIFLVCKEQRLKVPLKIYYLETAFETFPHILTGLEKIIPEY